MQPAAIAPDRSPKKPVKRRESGWRERLSDEQEQHWQKIRALGDQIRFHLSDRATYVHEDAIRWLAELPPCSIHAIVTDPPYGLIEYEDKQLYKRKRGRGGVWRIPPSFVYYALHVEKNSSLTGRIEEFLATAAREWLAMRKGEQATPETTGTAC
jgi:DNA modification methylase